MSVWFPPNSTCDISIHIEVYTDDLDKEEFGIRNFKWHGFSFHQKKKKKRTIDFNVELVLILACINNTLSKWTSNIGRFALLIFRSHLLVITIFVWRTVWFVSLIRRSNFDKRGIFLHALWKPKHVIWFPLGYHITKDENAVLYASRETGVHFERRLWAYACLRMLHIDQRTGLFEGLWLKLHVLSEML